VSGYPASAAAFLVRGKPGASAFLVRSGAPLRCAGPEVVAAAATMYTERTATDKIRAADAAVVDSSPNLSAPEPLREAVAPYEAAFDDLQR